MGICSFGGVNWLGPGVGGGGPVRTSGCWGGSSGWGGGKSVRAGAGWGGHLDGLFRCGWAGGRVLFGSNWWVLVWAWSVRTGGCCVGVAGLVEFKRVCVRGGVSSNWSLLGGAWSVRSGGSWAWVQASSAVYRSPLKRHARKPPRNKAGSRPPVTAHRLGAMRFDIHLK